MAATDNGIVEPVVVEAGEASPDGGVTAGDAIKGAAESAGKGAEIGSVVPVLGTLAGAVIGALSDIGDSIRNSVSSTPDDARRFLYEIGYRPGRELHHVKVLEDVSTRDKRLIRHERYHELADRSDYGRDTVNGWLSDALQTDGTEKKNPMPRPRYFGLMAEAFIQAELEQLLVDAGDVDVPGSAPYPIHRAIIARLRVPGGAADVIHSLRHPEAIGATVLPHATDAHTEALAHWVDHLMVVADDGGRNPVRETLRTWASVPSIDGRDVEGTLRDGFITDARGGVWRPLGWGSGLWAPLQA